MNDDLKNQADYSHTPHTKTMITLKNIYTLKKKVHSGATKDFSKKEIFFFENMGNSKSKRNGAKREKEMVNVVICVQSFQLLNPRSKIQRSSISINVGLSREKKQYVKLVKRDFFCFEFFSRFFPTDVL